MDDSPYAPPRAELSAPRTSRPTGFVHLIVWLSVAAVIMIARIWTSGFFEEFEVELPSTTLYVMSGGPMVAAILGFVFLILTRRIRNERNRAIINLMSILLAVIVVSASALALIGPMFSIMWALSR